MSEKEDVLILAIESSCDETAAAVVKNGREVLSNVINTQIAIHTEYGGVVPEIASRKHIENIDIDFFKVPYKKLSGDILYRYSFEGFIKEIFINEKEGV